MVSGKVKNTYPTKVTNKSDNNIRHQKLNKQKANSDFLKLLNNKLEVEKQNSTEDLKISKHAAKRIDERDMDLKSEEFFKIKEAIGKLKNKGGQDSLVITKKGAYIVDVEKNTIVTALNKNNLGNNVFTKIDSTIIID